MGRPFWPQVELPKDRYAWAARLLMLPPLVLIVVVAAVLDAGPFTLPIAMLAGTAGWGLSQPVERRLRARSRSGSN